ncbi:hypothetical protein ACA910_011628 [Epithemia clementina (nom. ined.)]
MQRRILLLILQLVAVNLGAGATQSTTTTSIKIIERRTALEESAAAAAAAAATIQSSPSYYDSWKQELTRAILHAYQSSRRGGGRGRQRSRSLREESQSPSQQSHLRLPNNHTKATTTTTNTTQTNTNHSTTNTLLLLLVPPEHRTSAMYRHMLSEQCANALSDLTNKSEKLQMAMDNVVKEINQAFYVDCGSSSSCQVDENQLPSTSWYMRECANAGGVIFEYNVTLQCNLFVSSSSSSEGGDGANNNNASNATGSSMTTTNTNYTTTTSKATTLLDRIEIRYLNVDQCADPRICTADDVADVAEHDADLTMASVEASFVDSDGTIRVECNAVVRPNPHNPPAAAVAASSSATTWSRSRVRTGTDATPWTLVPTAVWWLPPLLLIGMEWLP